jgi:dipeptidyl aminopeptidase/acylaminoacyl peptidase
MTLKLTFAMALLAAASASGAGRGITPEDYFSIETIPDVRLSPDGQRAAYVVTAVDAKANRRRSSIWVVPVAGNAAPVQFTTGASSASPRWSPDGKAVAFLSARSDAGEPARPQVWLLDLGGGEAKRLTNLPNGVESFAWSPDGARLACVGKTDPPGAKPASSDVRHYLSLNYKFNDTGWYDARRSHLFVVEVKTGKSTQITSAATRNDFDPRWSPDGARIAFAAEDTDQPLMRNGAIYAVPAAGGDAVSLSGAPGMTRLPRWSPDGARIAYVAAPTESAVARIYTAPSQGGAGAPASKDLDLAPSEIEWARDGRIWFAAGTRGTEHIFALDPASGRATPVTKGERAVRRFDLNERAATLVFTANDSTHGDDLFAADLSGANERRLTRLNVALWSQLELQNVERLPYAGVGGLPIEGFFLKPRGFEAGRKYPMVLVIHGGPSSMFGMDWFQEFQVYAARGWAVFYANPRGSSGYGEKFQRAVDMQWGGKAYEDLMLGVDAALAKYSWIDAARLGVTGGSYGGFMTNWIVGHTNRFRAAVTLRSISNLVSDEGTRDAAYGHDRDFGGDLFEHFETYWNSSPLQYARNVKTPTLILHSDNDLRVPLEQGEQWFRALKRFGVTTELVIFPRENHNLTRTGEPRHLVESLKWQIWWFERFLDGNEKAVAPDRQ